MADLSRDSPSLASALMLFAQDPGPHRCMAYIVRAYGQDPIPTLEQFNDSASEFRQGFIGRLVQAAHHGDEQAQKDIDTTLFEIQTLFQDEEGLRQEPIKQQKLYRLGAQLGLLAGIFPFHFHNPQEKIRRIQQIQRRIKSTIPNLPHDIKTFEELSQWLQMIGIGAPPELLSAIFRHPSAVNAEKPRSHRPADSQLALPKSLIGKISADQLDHATALLSSMLNSAKHMVMNEQEMAHLGDAFLEGLDDLSPTAMQLLDMMGQGRLLALTPDSPERRSKQIGSQWLTALVHFPNYFKSMQSYLSRRGFRAEDLAGIDEISRFFVELEAKNYNFAELVRNERLIFQKSGILKKNMSDSDIKALAQFLEQ